MISIEKNKRNRKKKIGSIIIKSVEEKILKSIDSFNFTF